MANKGKSSWFTKLVGKSQPENGGKFEAWQLKTGSSQFSFEKEKLDELLQKVDENQEEFMIVDPPAPVGDCNFIQLCPDINGIGFHLEVSLRKRDGGSLLLGKDALSTDQVREMILDFVERHAIPDTCGWEEIGTFE